MILAHPTQTTASTLINTNEMNVTAHMVDSNTDFNPYATMEQLFEWFRIQSLLLKTQN